MARSCKKKSFPILVGVYRKNIPAHTANDGYGGVIKVAETANIAKMAERCIKYIMARPTLPHKNPLDLGLENTFSARNRKNPERFMIFKRQKGAIFQHF